MLAEQFDAWVEALESGTYRQGNGVLRSKNDEYCCLGVFCDVVAPNAWDTNDGERMYAHRGACFAPSNRYTVPRGVCISFGIYMSLIDANDVHRLTFQQIANLLRCHRDQFVKEEHAISN